MSNVANPVAAEQALVLRRVFDAPRETVFRLWSDPLRVKEWWHPKGFTTTRFEMDFREGGTYRFSVRSEARESSAYGVYRVIDAPRRIIMSFQWDSGDPAHVRPTLLTLDFEAQGADKTLLTFCQEPFDSEADRISHGQGWGQVLDSFAATLAGVKA
jgi:uncharacterized protein YndB with AHSA1/START domain